MAKTWNEKMGYMMDESVNDKLDEEVHEYQKGNKLAEEMDEEEDHENRLSIFDSAVFDAVTKAQDLYCEEGASLKTVITALIDWLDGCKDKESELNAKLKEIKKDDNEEDEEE